jgi:hypothetical protein
MNDEATFGIWRLLRWDWRKGHLELQGGMLICCIDFPDLLLYVVFYFSVVIRLYRIITIHNQGTRHIVRKAP